MTIKIPGLDVEKGLDLYDNEVDIYLTVLRSFAAHTPAVLEKMRTVTEETLKDYQIRIHGIKGTSINIGAEETRITALKLEAMAKAGDIFGIQAQNGAFLKQTDELLANIDKWLKEYDSKAN